LTDSISTIYLPDVNVWVALAVDLHPHHSVAKHWAEQHRLEVLAFCRVTEMGLLRFLTNAKVMAGAPLSAAQAWGVRDNILSDPKVTMVKESDEFEKQWRRTARAGKVGPNFWTDAHLVSLCLASGCTLVTFDRALASKQGCLLHLLASN
jgi:toxin-antitoxin system PIN domain toxin